MIDKFYLVSAKGNLIPPNMTGNNSDSLFALVSDQEYREYINNNPQGIKWESRGEEIEILEDKVSIFGLPTPSYDKVVVIYPNKHPIYTGPENAVIYNEDGSIYLHLKVPELISSIARERKIWCKRSNIKFDADFRSVSWRKNNLGNLIIVVTIDFDWEWWESRVLNPETGEFGECLSSGRR